MEKKLGSEIVYNPSTMIGPTCSNCADKLTKSGQEPCVSCEKEDTPSNRFPKWRPAPEGGSTDEEILPVPSE